MLALTVCLLVAYPADSPPKLSADAQKELKALQGKWKVDRETEAGETKERGEEGALIEFQDRKFLLDGTELAEVSAIDPSTDPKCLDLKAVADVRAIRKGQEIELVYKLDGDTLTIALCLTEKKRPANLDAPKEAGTRLVVLKRVKK